MEKSSKPCVGVMAGPNGAGKSTLSEGLLRHGLGIETFLNADVIARGLSAFRPEGVAWQASQVMLQQMRKLAAKRESFAFETTLAARTLAPWFKELREDGYAICLFYVWLQNADLAVQRVAARVASGGHDIPIDDIRRRYERSVKNLWELYLPLADHWEIFDNSGEDFQVVASGNKLKEIVIHDQSRWEQIRR
ncbi:MAG: AAA family ATPase [Planctomycetaceae bacterium]|nr:AAA family ATPase [Planctomycetaceae bacterium]